MPQFPSREWMQAFCRELASQPDAGEVARVLDGIYRFVVSPSGPLPIEHRYDVKIEPRQNGQAPSVVLLDEHAAHPRLVLTASYDRWRQLITGQLDVGMAVVLRRLRVSGDLSPLVGGLGSAKPLLVALSAVDSEWL